tara:strand:- start:2174 stop:2755 length:582 start_codon:yes stop_codon:yes gene_type:complete
MTHYFDFKQDSDVKVREVDLNIRGIDFPFLLVSGTFSSRKVDKGTLVLCENMLVDETWDVLDLGCGVGVVGVVAGKFCSKIYLSDPNLRAVTFAKENLKRNGVKGKVKVGSGFVFNKKFDSILLNPPQTAGKKICFELISEAKNNLKNSGVLQVVARRNKGGEAISLKMKEVFGNVGVRVRKSGYWVYVSRLE